MQAIEFMARRMRDFAPRTIFDVGANQGQSAQALRKAYSDARIYCFEPVPSSRDLLETAMLGDEGTTVLPIALGRRQATMRMQARTANPMNRLLRTDESNTNSIEVDVTTGDLFCLDRGVDTIDFLKIDTEGSDLDVLLGFGSMLAAKKLRVIQVEAGMSPDNDRHIPLARYLPFFGDHGYLLLHLFDEVRRNHRQPVERQQLRGMWFCNAVFVAEDEGSLILGPSGMNR
ncbi:FkbM family methyltransferase [Roseomonas sp. CAU 1739]|uniref:FkbM family methyltransferase n=1 Tax=Roseomonas sp. CAU 1739 TaxID=3140364 RepID=UPI00325B0368